MSNGPAWVGVLPAAQTAPLPESVWGRSSMLQSWGTSSVRHAEALKSGISAPDTSPRRNRQSWVNAKLRSRLFDLSGHGAEAGVFSTAADALIGSIAAAATPAIPWIASRRVNPVSLFICPLGFDPCTSELYCLGAHGRRAWGEGAIDR